MALREEWVVQITHMLQNPDEHSQANADSILRVARPLLNSKQEAYIPQIFSLGPYHHGKLEKDIESSCGGGKISTAEAYKGKSAAKLAQKLRNCGKNFGSIVEIMEKNQQKIEQFYQWPISRNTEGEGEGEYSRNFALMMAVDSSFLLCFLISLADGGQSTSDDEMMSLYPYIKHDILKLENQIPLAVLKQVFEEVNTLVDCNFYQLLQTTLAELSPFPPHTMDIDDVARDMENDEVASRGHLLGCMHAYVSKILDIQIGEGHHERRRLLLHSLAEIVSFIWAFTCFVLCCCLPFLAKVERTFLGGISAAQFSGAGIRFKSFSTLPNMIRFDRHSATLYLPQITVRDMHTEVVLRNMLALEFNNIAGYLKPVTRYVALMGYLLQSPDDVRILVDGGVIIRGDCRLTDEVIFNMWRGVSQPFFPPSLGIIPDELWQDAKKVLTMNLFKTKTRRTIGGLIDIWSNWKFLGSLAASLGILLTAIQTYCAVVQLIGTYGNN